MNLFWSLINVITLHILLIFSSFLYKIFIILSLISLIFITWLLHWSVVLNTRYIYLKWIFHSLFCFASFASLIIVSSIRLILLFFDLIKNIFSINVIIWLTFIILIIFITFILWTIKWFCIILFAFTHFWEWFFILMFNI